MFIRKRDLLRYVSFFFGYQLIKMRYLRYCKIIVLGICYWNEKGRWKL